jgi:ADP-ribose pyrophosphatase YjhB (NUDIX family)
VTARCCLACGAPLRAVRDGAHVRRRCPRCGWTFYANAVPAVAALVVRRGRVLLTRRARPPYAGLWDLPGGFLETWESPERGLAREVREELGVGIRRARLLGFSTDRYGRHGPAVLSIVYRVTLGRGVIHAADDVQEVRWVAIDRLPWRTIAFPALKRLMRRALRAATGS